MHALIIEVISTNNADIVKVGGYGGIADKYEATNNPYIVCFTSVPCTLQEYAESDGKKYHLVTFLQCNIYTSLTSQIKILCLSIYKKV